MGSTSPDKLRHQWEELPMTTMPRLSVLASTMLLSLGLIAPTQAQQAPNMTFFVTSVGPGKGGDLGGLLARTPTASPWQRRRERAARPGAPILALTLALKAAPSTPANASGMARGRTSGATW
jgi:hypothetical protein